MKKVLFLMFLLFLIGLGTAHAQVRIGGNSAPQGAAVLDLNADNTATPTANKGALALPRVRLDSTTMQLNGITPITGMLVWNTNTTLGVGIYFWSGTAWVKTSLPVTSVSDSGKFLMSNGVTWTTAIPYISGSDTIAKLTLKDIPPTVTWTTILDTSLSLPPMLPWKGYWIQVPGLTQADFCKFSGGNNFLNLTQPNPVFPALYVATSNFVSRGAQLTKIRCYRPSF